jgi:hypothetical protein
LEREKEREREREREREKDVPSLEEIYETINEAGISPST